MENPPKRPKSLAQHRRDLERKREKKKQKRLTNKKKKVAKPSLVEKGGNVVRHKRKKPSLEWWESDDSENNDNDEDIHSNDTDEVFTPRVQKPPAGVTPSAACCEKRRATKEGPTETKQPASKQRWTELTAVGHILADETHTFMNHAELSSGERRQLSTWADSVQKKIYHQSTLVLENVRLQSEFRENHGKVQSLRDDLVIMRTQTKQLERECDCLEAQLSQSRKGNTALHGATRFLTKLSTLANKNKT